ncbi:BMC domain-containing protein [Saliterribacillus persicus]|uniref:BMC domain-containing protein n=1 Tax=Saliterribacillus persicus TaxID=930114 RepID=A0A368XVL5_9BACI|nr:BMC domain-containing protein [Saliterribacillus persicus]RCW71935.1 BMC domain-containing protein [Saliterribacillus persicus]
MAQAVGMLEVQGYSVALVAMDEACKAADLKIEAMDCNNPSNERKPQIPVIVQVKFTGKLSDVQIGLEVARKTASNFIDDKDILTHLIASHADGLENLLPLGKVKQPK